MRHEWIALFATLVLFDGVGVAFCIVPHIVRWGAIERSDERQASVCKGDLKQAVRHAGAGDVVERPNPRQHRGWFVGGPVQLKWPRL